MYGVSPQPAQAPENSNSGCSACEPLTESCGSRSRSSSGMDRKKSHVRPLRVAVVQRRLHVDRLVTHLGLRLRRAHVDADTAAGAVVRRHLDRHAVAGDVLGAEVLGLERCRGAVERRRLEHLHPDRRVRADDGALAAVDADVGVPDRDLLGDGPLLVLGGARRERAVDGEAPTRAAGRLRPPSAGRSPAATKSGTSSGSTLRRLRCDVAVAGTSTRAERGERGVDGRVVALDDGRAARRRRTCAPTP